MFTSGLKTGWWRRMGSTEYSEQIKQNKIVKLFHLKNASEVLRNRNFYIALLLFAVCVLIYYLGELVDLTGWEALRWSFLYEVHDIQRLLFFAPIMYVCYYFGFKAMMVVIAASLISFLPRAIFISPFPNPVLRATLFVVIACALCSFIRLTRNKLQKYPREAVVENENNGIAGDDNRINGRVFTIGTLEVDLSKRMARRHGQILKLTPKEYKLLSYLVCNSGKVLSHSELLHNVWGPEYGQESEYLRTFIRQLRCKIEDNPSDPRFIVTEPGIGYRFTDTE
jgi:DNA-binding winged helix-turn-helix (wHTH) protein